MNWKFTPRRSLQPPQTNKQILLSAAQNFVARWRLIKVMRDGQMRQIEAGLVLLSLIGLFVIGWVWDEESVLWFVDLPESWIKLFSLITQLGLSGYLIFILIAFCITGLLEQAKARNFVAQASLGLYAGRAFFLLSLVLTSGLFSQILKHLFGRARPKLFDMVGAFHFDAFSISASLASFPSGHTVTAFATAIGLSWFLPRWRWPLLIIAALVGLSRIVLGQHYPSDVVGGALLAFGSALLLRRAFGNRRIVFRLTEQGYQPRRARPLWSLVKKIPLRR